jgi:DNA-binding MarR family transcriptional regulator
LHPKINSKAEYEVLAEFRYALPRFKAFGENTAEEAGLTTRQHQALPAIKGFPGRKQITVGGLSECLQINHHSAVGLIDRLEVENLIDHSAGLTDRRQVYISLTEHGLSILEKLSTIHREELRRLTPQLRLLLKRITKLSERRN